MPAHAGNPRNKFKFFSPHPQGFGNSSPEPATPSKAASNVIPCDASWGSPAMFPHTVSTGQIRSKIFEGFPEFRRSRNWRPGNPKAGQAGPTQPSSTTSYEITDKKMQTSAVGSSHVANGIPTLRFTTFAAGGPSSTKGRRRKDHQVVLPRIPENLHAREEGRRGG